MNQPKNILIIRLGALGDIILTAGSVRDIRNAYPDATIHFLTTKPYAKLQRRNPDIDHIHIAPRAHRLKWWTMTPIKRELRRLNIDRVFDLQDTGRTQGYRRWLKPVQWVGSAPGISHPVSKEVATEKRALVNMAGRVKAGGVEPVHASKPDVRWMADPVDEVLSAHHVPERYVLLIPGCSAKNPHKRWPYYDELAERLQQAGYACVTAPGPDELDLCASIPATMLMRTADDGPQKPLTYFELAGVAAKACYAVGNDTGPSHIAAHCGTPGLGLFGGDTKAAHCSLDTVWSVIETDELKTLSVERVFEQALADLQSQADQSNSV